MLKHLGITRVKLMTNNPRKLDSMKQLHIQAERVEHLAAPTQFNTHYLSTKASKLGHWLTSTPPNPTSGDDQSS